MLWETFHNLSGKKSLRLVVYPADIFERRAQEEIVRSDESKGSFVYIEIDFFSLDEKIPVESDREIFLYALLDSLKNDIRSIDFVGYLPKNQGIALILPESREEGWSRFEDSLLERLPKRRDLFEIFKASVRPIIYPITLAR